MTQSGDGWASCALPHHRDHWGRYGAAGLFLIVEGHLLLQHRAEWSDLGGTWGLPGGALHRDETAKEGAIREAVEETGIDVATIEFFGEFVDDHGGWTYTTVLAHAPLRLAIRPGVESKAVEWVPLAKVGARSDLHPGFAATLQRVLEVATATG